MHLDGLSTSLKSLRLVEDPVILQDHLETIYQDTLRKDMKRLERDLKAFGIDTVTAAINIRVALPIAATSLAELAHAPLPVPPVIAAGGAVAFGLAEVFRAKRRQAWERLESSPAAYLLHLQERLQPARLITVIQRHFRRFLTGA
jgi:hypothetical protein